MPKTIAPHHMPGIVTVPLSDVYAFYAEGGVDICAKVTDHVKEWAASVPVGTMVTVWQMLAFGQPCNCLPEFYAEHMGGGCCGLKSLAPLEIVMDVLFPPDGSPCAIPGVKALTSLGPMPEHGLGLLKYIQKTS